MILSKSRSKSVKESLISKGINYDRLETRAYGESSPKYQNSPLSERKKNRRVKQFIFRSASSIKRNTRFYQQ